MNRTSSIVHSEKDYQQQQIERLAAWAQENLPHSVEITPSLLENAATYLELKFKSNRIHPTEICSLLGEGLQKLQERLNKPDAKLIGSVNRFFLTTVKNLAITRFSTDDDSQRFLISEKGISIMEAAQAPVSALKKFENMVSPKTIAYRTFLDRFNAAYIDSGYSENELAIDRSHARNAFRVRLKTELVPETPNPGDWDKASPVIEAMRECLNQLDQKDREMIKLRYGISPEWHGDSFSFEELIGIFDFKSISQVSNRCSYVQRTLLKACMKSKGFYRV